MEGLDRRAWVLGSTGGGQGMIPVNVGGQIMYGAGERAMVAGVRSDTLLVSGSMRKRMGWG
ncbi:MAG: hypothetical protein ABT10_24850 [Novosphingobium sp. SCN 63-17]|nr:MAG: hypothetical protein ABT10_24850 [Novosphingobium sp. SCN 63-17]